MNDKKRFAIGGDPTMANQIHLMCEPLGDFAFQIGLEIKLFMNKPDVETGMASQAAKFAQDIRGDLLHDLKVV